MEYSKVQGRTNVKKIEKRHEHGVIEKHELRLFPILPEGI